MNSRTDTPQNDKRTKTRVMAKPEASERENLLQARKPDAPRRAGADFGASPPTHRLQRALGNHNIQRVDRSMAAARRGTLIQRATTEEKTENEPEKPAEVEQEQITSEGGTEQEEAQPPREEKEASLSSFAAFTTELGKKFTNALFGNPPIAAWYESVVSLSIAAEEAERAIDAAWTAIEATQGIVRGMTEAEDIAQAVEAATAAAKTTQEAADAVKAEAALKSAAEAKKVAKATEATVEAAQGADTMGATTAAEKAYAAASAAENAKPAPMEDFWRRYFGTNRQPRRPASPIPPVSRFSNLIKRAAPVGYPNMEPPARKTPPPIPVQKPPAPSAAETPEATPAAGTKGEEVEKPKEKLETEPQEQTEPEGAAVGTDEIETAKEEAELTPEELLATLSWAAVGPAEWGEEVLWTKAFAALFSEKTQVGGGGSLKASVLKLPNDPSDMAQIEPGQARLLFPEQSGAGASTVSFPKYVSFGGAPGAATKWRVTDTQDNAPVPPEDLEQKTLPQPQKTMAFTTTLERNPQEPWPELDAAAAGLERPALELLDPAASQFLIDTFVGATWNTALDIAGTVSTLEPGANPFNVQLLNQRGLLPDADKMLTVLTHIALVLSDAAHKSRELARQWAALGQQLLGQGRSLMANCWEQQTYVYWIRMSAGDKMFAIPRIGWYWVFDWQRWTDGANLFKRGEQYLLVGNFYQQLAGQFASDARVARVTARRRVTPRKRDLHWFIPRLANLDKLFNTAIGARAQELQGKLEVVAKEAQPAADSAITTGLAHQSAVIPELQLQADELMDTEGNLAAGGVMAPTGPLVQEPESFWANFNEMQVMDKVQQGWSGLSGRVEEAEEQHAARTERRKTMLQERLDAIEDQMGDRASERATRMQEQLGQMEEGAETSEPPQLQVMGQDAGAETEIVDMPIEGPPEQAPRNVQVAAQNLAGLHILKKQLLERLVVVAEHLEKKQPWNAGMGVGRQQSAADQAKIAEAIHEGKAHIFIAEQFQRQIRDVLRTGRGQFNARWAADLAQYMARSLVPGLEEDAEKLLETNLSHRMLKQVAKEDNFIAVWRTGLRFPQPAPDLDQVLEQRLKEQPAQLQTDAAAISQSMTAANAEIEAGHDAAAEAAMQRTRAKLNQIEAARARYLEFDQQREQLYAQNQQEIGLLNQEREIIMSRLEQIMAWEKIEKETHTQSLAQAQEWFSGTRAARREEEERELVAIGGETALTGFQDMVLSGEVEEEEEEEEAAA